MLHLSANHSRAALHPSHRKGNASPSAHLESSFLLSQRMSLSRHKVDFGRLPNRNSVQVPSWKRPLDIACVLIALPVLAPLMLIVAFAVKIGSAGPILFGQERVGYRGRRFTCLKFRSMHVGADTAVHRQHWNHLMASNLPMAKMDTHGDPRLIPGGWWLRASGLDELPQVINVLRGEMSLVGPRPCLSYEYDKYLPWQKERFNTLPGLTGLWQVSGKNKTTLDDMMHLDIHYARNKDLWFDLKIILMTIPSLIVQVRDTQGRRKSFARFGQRSSVVSAQTTNGSPLQGSLPVGRPNLMRDSYVQEKT
jgi:lipopolysaccharide/colanic/teichoic acid biosynthesis glycosyltransferase